MRNVLGEGFMKLYYYIAFILVGLTGCKKDAPSENYAYLGGEIINPNTNFVVIYKSDAVLDTVKLDSNNRFIYKINHLKTGLHTFRHGEEIQVVLLEPKDSIIFRLNTFDFDESLVFTGEGDEKNNYLINDFLQNEIDEKHIFRFCQLDPMGYETRIDSLRQIKIDRLKKFQNKYNPSDLFNKIAKASIDYSYYSSKEIYPFVHYGEHKRDILNALPKDFYDFRKDVDYNDDFHKDYFNYNSFLKSTFNNMALKEHLNHTETDEFSMKSLCYNLDRMAMVDKTISNQSIKNNLLNHYTFNYLARSNDPEGNKAILKSFMDKSTSDKDKKMVASVVSSLSSLKPGDDFPNVKLLDFKNNEVVVSSFLKRPTVLYFWSHAFYDHFKESHYKANELMVKYPEVSFISVNIDGETSENCMASMKKNRFSCKNEYKFKDPKEAKQTLAIYPITKTIILDQDKKIVNSNTNIFDINFEEQLLGLLNK